MSIMPKLFFYQIVGLKKNLIFLRIRILNLKFLSFIFKYLGNIIYIVYFKINLFKEPIKLVP